MSLRSLHLLVGGTVLLAAACAEPEDSLPDDDERVGDADMAIQGGYVDDADTNVVGIYNFEYGSVCTGSLIAPNMVLTARHCVSNTYNESGGGVVCGQTNFSNPFDAGGFAVTTVKDMWNAYEEDYVLASEVIIIPGEEYLCGGDQAILILGQSIPESLAKPLIPRVDSALIPDEGYIAIGYGESSDGGGNSGIRRRRDGLLVYCAEDSCVGVSDYVKVTEWIGDTGICSGDSGGPAIDLQGRVVGVTSRGGPDCSSPVYGSVHRWGEWIKTSAIHAAAVGGYPVPLWATGFPTDPGFNTPVGGDCTANACSTCWDNVCTRLCNDTNAPCPEGFSCDTVNGGTQLCVELPPPPEPEEEEDGGSDGESEEDDGCTVAPGGVGSDPTNPVPWLLSIGGLALAAMRRRRCVFLASPPGTSHRR